MSRPLAGLLAVWLAAAPAGAVDDLQEEVVEGAWLSPVELTDPDDPLSLAHPEKLLLVIYNHGSRPEFRLDRCHPEGATTPDVVRDLAGAEAGRLEVAVFAFCTRSLLGEFDEVRGEGEPKVVKRAREIAGLAQRFVAAGVPPRQIVLAGQSAGGWAALLAAAALGMAPAGNALEGGLGGVIAFAPGFAGPVEDRPETWQVIRDAQAAELADLPGLNALVYAFEGDRYEPPSDLAFLDKIPGVELLQRPGDSLGGHDCRPHEAHLRAFTDCFRATESRPLLRFLAARAQLAGGA